MKKSEVYAIAIMAVIAVEDIPNKFEVLKTLYGLLDSEEYAEDLREKAKKIEEENDG